MTRLVILASWLSLLSPAFAQTGAPPPSTASNPSPPQSDIVVEHRTNDALARLVKAMTSTPQNTQVARWKDAICVRAIDFDDTHAAFIEARLGVVANAYKIDVLHKPCRPNIVILATMDADAFAKAFVERFPTLLHDPVYGLAHGAAIDEFVAPRPVRWIDASRTGSADGGGFGNYGGGSRIKQSTRENVVASVVLVDMLRMTHIDWAQLADYVAFVTMARPAMTATTQDSILSIFAARDAGSRGPLGLTATDQALLGGLYHSDPTLMASRQRSEIMSRMRKQGR